VKLLAQPGCEKQMSYDRTLHTEPELHAANTQTVSVLFQAVQALLHLKISDVWFATTNGPDE
jgi:hypothetical protein